MNETSRTLAVLPLSFSCVWRKTNNKSHPNASHSASAPFLSADFQRVYTARLYIYRIGSLAWSINFKSIYSQHKQPHSTGAGRRSRKLNAEPSALYEISPPGVPIFRLSRPLKQTPTDRYILHNIHTCHTVSVHMQAYSRALVKYNGTQIYVFIGHALWYFHFPFYTKY